MNLLLKILHSLAPKPFKPPEIENLSKNGTREPKEKILTRKTIIGIVEIRRSKQSSENQLGNVHFLDLMFDNGNSAAVIPNADFVLGTKKGGIKEEKRRRKEKETYGSISILIVDILGSRCLLSAAFTTISSKILYKPGTYVIDLTTSFSDSIS